MFQYDYAIGQVENCMQCNEFPFTEEETSHNLNIDNGLNCNFTIFYIKRSCGLNYDLIIKNIIFNSGSDCLKLQPNEIFNIAIVKLLSANPFNLDMNNPMSGNIRIIYLTCWKIFNNTFVPCELNDCCTTIISFNKTIDCPMTYTIDPIDLPCKECIDNTECINICSNDILEKFAKYFEVTNTSTPEEDCSDFQIDAGKDLSFCPNSGSVQVQARGGNNYLWSPSTYLDNPNISNPMVNLPESVNHITYTVTATRGNCVATDEIVLSRKSDFEANAGDDISICLGESARLSASGGISYHWEPASSFVNPNFSDPIVNPTVTTTYTVTVKDGNCEASDDVTVTVNPLPIVNIVSNLTICSGDCITLNAMAPPGVTYEWSPKVGLSNPNNQNLEDPNYLNISNPRACPKVPTCYTITVTNEFGCTATGKVCIDIIGYSKKQYVYASIMKKEIMPEDTVPVQFTIVPDMTMEPITQFELFVEYDSTDIGPLSNGTGNGIDSTSLINIEGFEAWNFNFTNVMPNSFVISGIGIPVLNTATIELKLKLKQDNEILSKIVRLSWKDNINLLLCSYTTDSYKKYINLVTSHPNN